MKTLIDNFLKDPMSLRQKALHAGYQDIVGPNGETYKRVSLVPGRLVKARLSDALGVQLDVETAVLRCNWRGDAPNQSIHADSLYSNHAAVLYLSPDDECRGGTALWRHRETGLDSWPTALTIQDPVELTRIQGVIAADWTKPEKFEMTELIQARFNRLAVYPTAAFHSRWIGSFLPADQEANASDFEGYGETLETGRLILAIFFNITK